MKNGFILSFLSIIIFNNLSYSKDENLKNDREMKKFEKTSIQNLLLNEQNKPQPPLDELFEIFSIKHDGTLKNMIELTQKEWLRKPGKERWEIEELKVEDKEKVINALKKLGCIDQVTPKALSENTQKKNKKNATVEADFILAGATIFRISSRMGTVVKTYNDLFEHYKKQGLNFKVRNFILLGSERKRDATAELDEYFTKEYDNLPVKKDWKFDGQYPETEIDMIKFVFNKINFPKSFIDNAQVIFVSAPMQKNPDGTMRRATTGDTIEEMQKELKKRDCNLIKTYLFSNNPYVAYQDSVTRTYLPKDIDLETIGDAAPKNEKIAVHLDNIARWLYQENIRRNK